MYTTYILLIQIYMLGEGSITCFTTCTTLSVLIKKAISMFFFLYFYILCIFIYVTKALLRIVPVALLVTKKEKKSYIKKYTVQKNIDASALLRIVPVGLLGEGSITSLHL
jgi:hypothetical protein